MLLAAKVARHRHRDNSFMVNQGTAVLETYGLFQVASVRGDQIKKEYICV